MRKRLVESEVVGLNGEVHIIEFSNLKSVVENSSKYKQFSGALDSAKRGNDDWATGRFGGQSVERIINGNSEFEKPRELAFITASGVGQRRRKRYTDIGTDVDVMRALGGSMNPYVQKTKIDSSGRNIRLIIAMTIHSEIKADAIYDFAIACMHEAYKLSANGYMVSIETAFVVSNGTAGTRRGAAMLFKIKDSKEVFDFKRIATMAYPAFFRMFMMRALHNTGEPVPFGYGTPVRSLVTTQEFMEKHVDRDSVVIEFSNWEQTKVINYKNKKND